MGRLVEGGGGGFTKEDTIILPYGSRPADFRPPRTRAYVPERLGRRTASIAQRKRCTIGQSTIRPVEPQGFPPGPVTKPR